jgi:hypothetical protein
MDMITDLPMADGFDSILVVVDQGLLKGVNFIPCNKTLTSIGTARLLLENFVQTVRTSGQKNHFGQSPTICIKSLPGTLETTWNKISTINSLSPPN